MACAFRVREAVRTDADVMVNMLMALARETENLELDEEAVRRGVTTPFERGNVARLYVAEEVPQAGAAVVPRLIGVMTVTYEWSDWRGGHVLWIQSAYVAREWRGRGVFRVFFEQVQRLVREEAGYVGMRLSVSRANLNAIEVYKRLGMTAEDYCPMKCMKSKY